LNGQNYPRRPMGLTVVMITTILSVPTPSYISSGRFLSTIKFLDGLHCYALANVQ
jgi:hypothetical protein